MAFLEMGTYDEPPHSARILTRREEYNFLKSLFFVFKVTPHGVTLDIMHSFWENG